jgi:hypothetical protein
MSSIRLRTSRVLRLVGAGLLAASAAGCISFHDGRPVSVLTEVRTAPDTAVLQERAAVGSRTTISVRN